MLVSAIVLAAGFGARFGGPKHLAPLAGTRVVDRSLRTAAESCDQVVLVLAEPLPAWTGQPLSAVVAGGATRSSSVRAGLEAVDPRADVIVVHDAARPLARASLFADVIAAVAAGADAAVPGIPTTDTLKEVMDGVVIRTLARDTIFSVQTPQAFAAAVLRSAHHGAPEGTDDAALVEAIRGRVVVVPGDRRNLKITDPDDLRVAEALLEQP